MTISGVVLGLLILAGVVLLMCDHVKYDRKCGE